MKKIFLFVLILMSAGFGYAQNSLAMSWETYREKHFGINNSYNYISHGYRSGADSVKYYLYYKINGKTVLAYFENMKLVKETVFDSTDLFDMVKQNLAALKKIRNGYARFYKKDHMPEKQLGIRFSGLHFNHYGKKDAAFINGLKNKKLKDGFTTINLLIDSIEKG